MTTHGRSLRHSAKREVCDMGQIPWQEIRAQYERGGVSYMALSKQYGVAASRIGKRAKREDWGGDRKQYARKRFHGDLDGVTERLIAIASDMVNKTADGEEMDVKTLKELTAVLKELNHLTKNKNEAKADDPLVRVVLEGEAAEWGR